MACHAQYTVCKRRKEKENTKLHIIISKLLAIYTVCVCIYIYLYTRTYMYIHTEWPKKMYTLFTHQYLWNKFK